jgi:5-methylcytosine-specific restriction protein A
MPRSVPEWIGKTDDTPVPDRVKLRVFEKFEGVCPKCTRELQPGAWDCDHAIPLIVGGENRENNLQPLCSDPCHSRKTALDVKLKAKVASVRKRHLGIKKPRTIRAWRRFNGEIVHAERER